MKILYINNDGAGFANFIEVAEAQHRASKTRLRGAFDPGRSERNPVLLLQHLVGCHRLAIDADQVVFGRTAGHLVAKQLLDGRT